MPESVTLGKKKAERIKDDIRRYVSLLCDSSMALLASQGSGGVVKKDLSRKVMRACESLMMIPAFILIELVVCGVSGPIFSKAFPW